MKQRIAPIEIEHASGEIVQTGRIRALGSVNPAHRKPDLLAHRPEAFRFFRLAVVIGAAKAFASVKNADGPRRLEASLASFGDFKGDFTAVWRTKESREEFGPLIDQASLIEG